MRKNQLEKTIALVAAHRTLSDPQKRKLYDFRIVKSCHRQRSDQGMKLLQG